MNIGILGYGKVAKELTNLLHTTDHKLFSWRNSPEVPRDQYFKKIWGDETPHPITQKNMIGLVVDTLGNRQDSTAMSKDSIEKSLKNNKVVITCNKELIEKESEYVNSLLNEQKDRFFAISVNGDEKDLALAILNKINELSIK